jgi:hypothetical protein
MSPPDAIVALLEQIRRQHAARWVRLPVGREGVRLWRGLFPDGSSLIVKEGRGLEREIAVHESVRGQFLPRLIAADADLGFLALEDLTDFGRPPPWTRRQLELVLQALDELGGATPPRGLPPARHRAVTNGWSRVADDPKPLLGLFMCTERWLKEALPTLIAAEAEAVVDGERLVHMNVRAGNVLVGPDRAVLLDWQYAAVGSALLDVAMLAPSLAQDGGPAPETVVGQQPAIAAAMAGHFASEAGRSDGHPTVRAYQFEQLAVCLPWASRALGLADPLGGGGCFGGLGRSG